MRRVVGLVVGEDLVDAEGYVGEEETAFYHVAAAASDTPCAEKDGASDGHADEDCVLAVDAGESRDTPEEIDGAADNTAAEKQHTDCPDVLAIGGVDQVFGQASGGLNDK